MASKEDGTGRVWRRAPAELVTLFKAAVAPLPGAELRQMFGYPCAFVEGQMFCGVHQENVIVRLNAGDRQRLLAIPGAAVFEPMAGRPMREYVILPPAVIASPDDLSQWLEKAIAYTGSLPPKEPASRSRPKAVPAKPRQGQR